MMNKKVLYLYASIISFAMLAAGCSQPVPVTSEPDTEPDEETTDADLATADNTYVLGGTELMGVYPGLKVADVNATVEEDVLQTGEGDFEIYNIYDKQGSKLGYFTLGGEEADEVGNIYITAETIVTREGIRIGSTFGDLKALYPSVVAYGSEIEGYTSAEAGPYVYELDSRNWSYDLEDGAVTDETKITGIVIR